MKILLFSICLSSILISGQNPNFSDPILFPQFFQKLIQSHQSGFYRKDSATYLQFCEEQGVASTNVNNKSKYFTLVMLHELFTAQTARNGSMGQIMKIPYYWHWVKPNPRYLIYDVKTGQLLKDQKPTSPHAKYASRADIDRTPYLFLSDLMKSSPSYYTTLCDTFATFGWCSEREMAFVCLLDLLGMEAKVVAEGNHCWSESWVLMEANDGSFKAISFTIDNTFNRFWSQKKSIGDKVKWKKELGNLAMTTWYNNNAHSENEKRLLMQYRCPILAMQRLDQAYSDFLHRP